MRGFFDCVTPHLCDLAVKHRLMVTRSDCDVSHKGEVKCKLDILMKRLCINETRLLSCISYISHVR